MKTSTEIESISKLIGEEKAVELVAKAGFDAWDFSMFRMCECSWETGEITLTDHPLSGRDYLKFARKLRNIGEDCGIVCNQSHAPFPSHYHVTDKYLKRAIECTAEAGGKICVIHPDERCNEEVNAEMYLDLLPFAKKCGVSIATENMWTWDKATDRAAFSMCATEQSFCHMLNLVDDDSFVACLDIGHAEMMGDIASASGLIKALGKKLAALHIHDNDRHRDLHQLPFTMSIDFGKVAEALKQIGYNGYLTLEAPCYIEGYTADNVHHGVRELYKSVNRLNHMIG